MSGTVAVSAFGGPIRPKAPGPSQLSAPTGPDQGEYEPRQREQQVRERAHEQQRQQRDHQQRQPHQRQHPWARGLLILLFNNRGRHATHAQRAHVRLRQVVDRQLRVVNGLVAGVAQPDGGDRDRRAIRVRSGHHVEHRSRRLQLRGSPDMVKHRIDLLLRDRVEVGHLKQGFHQQRRCSNCVDGRQELPYPRGTNDTAEQTVHLGEPIRREHFPTENERYHDNIGVPEKGLDLLQRLRDGAIPGKERLVLRHRRPLRNPSSQHQCHDRDSDKRDPRAHRHQPTQPVKHPTYGTPPSPRPRRGTGDTGQRPTMTAPHPRFTLASQPDAVTSSGTPPTRPSPNSARHLLSHVRACQAPSEHPPCSG